MVVRSDASDITLTFKDRTFLASNSDAEQAGRHLLDFADALTGKLIDEKYVQRIHQADARGDGGATRLLVKTAEWNLMDLYPAGIVYKIQADREYDYEGSGYMIYWLNLYAQGAGWTPVCDTTMQTDVSYVPNRWFRSIYDITDGTVKEVPGKRPYDKAVVYIDVDAKCDETGRMSFFFNGVRRPTFLFDLNKTYHFINRSGSKCPLRFIGNMHAPIANNIDDVITDGVVVLHGNTDIEEIFVNPELVLKSGHCIGAYQCVCYPDMGNVVYNHPLDMCGNYNMCRVGGGIYNPRMAGESDYVYLQLQVSGECDPGEAVPQLEIGYDET